MAAESQFNLHHPKTMLPSLISVLALDSASPSPLKRSLSRANGAVALVFVVVVVFLAVAVAVTFLGFKSMRLSIFLSTMLVAVTASALFADELVVLAVAGGLGLVVSLAPPLRKEGIFFVGMAFGATIVDVVHSAVLLTTASVSSTFSVVALAVTGVVAIGCGCVALAENAKFLIRATSVVGGFTAAACIAVAAILFLRLTSPVGVILMLLDLGAAFTSGGMAAQFGALKASADESVAAATPVQDETVV